MDPKIKRSTLPEIGLLRQTLVLQALYTWHCGAHRRPTRCSFQRTPMPLGTNHMPHLCCLQFTSPAAQGILLKHRFLDKCKFLWCPLRTGLWTPFLPHHPHFPPHSSFSTRLRPGSALGNRSSCFIPQSPWTRSILPGTPFP